MDFLLTRDAKDADEGLPPAGQRRYGRADRPVHHARHSRPQAALFCATKIFRGTLSLEMRTGALTDERGGEDDG
jgi:hypothetical protein